MNLFWRKEKHSKTLGNIASIVYFCVGMLLIITFNKPLRAYQTASTDGNVPILKAKEPVEIIGTVIAMTRDPWMGADWSLHILLLRVDRVLDGKRTERYVRTDFLNRSVYDNSEESLAYSKLVSAFHEKRTWKFQLHPPHGISGCWKIPPPPTPGDYITSRNPDIQPIGGATGYPNINTLPCYAFYPVDVQEIRSPESDQKKNN
jgi:hypothetical protein